VRFGAKQIHESHKKVASEKAAESREKISQSVDYAKDKARSRIDEFKRRATLRDTGRSAV